MRAVLRGIQRTIGTARAGKAPATADLIGQMLALCPATMIGKRDRALLCLGFAGAFRRSELVALEVADLAETPDGLRVLIRRSKGDQEGQGQEGAIPRGLPPPPGRGDPDVAGQRRSAPAGCSGRWDAAEGSRARAWRTTARRGS